ncbi:MAG: class I SAM-dependent methyltransferase [Epsilonproteobacteria bacterium]|nr:class I SAM-dependent methyltransferase [Campylobacterota bacterium]NPA56627.1 class I SAM-dependent methyltransferase [Campylobacterota bacterium]
MGIDLYGQIEDLLGFEEERQALHRLFLQRLLDLGARRVLDIGCGSGSFIEMAREEGLDVEGIDLSREMVERAEKRGVPCRRIDICQVEGRYDAAVAIFDVMNYIEPSKVGTFLSCIARILKPRGHFLADINTLYGFEEVAPGALWIDRGDRFLALEADFDHQSGRLSTDIVYFEKREECFVKYSDNIAQFYHAIDDLKGDGLKIVDLDLITLFGDEADKALIVYQKD